jgi:hypothetical protein
MGKLTQRYSPEEKARLLTCLKPVERWTKYEQQLWARSHHGFRHFVAPNVTPIEHYRPEPIGVFEAYGRDNAKPRRTRRTPGPPRESRLRDVMGESNLEN